MSQALWFTDFTGKHSQTGAIVYCLVVNSNSLKQLATVPWELDPNLWKATYHRINAWKKNVKNSQEDFERPQRSNYCLCCLAQRV